MGQFSMKILPDTGSRLDGNQQVRAEGRLPLCLQLALNISVTSNIVNIEHMRYSVDMAKETSYPVKKLINLTEEHGHMISDFRFENRIASENEAIRQLIELGLKAWRDRMS